MGKADEFDFAALARAADIVRIHSGAVGRFEAVDFRGSSFGDHRHAFGKESVDADDGFVAGFEGIEYSRLDAAGAGGGNGIGHAVVGLEDEPQHGLDVVHHVLEPGVQVAHHGSGHHARHARVHAGGAGSQH